MKPTGVPQPVRLGEPYESVESPYPPVMQISHASSSMCVLAILALYSMNLYVYLTDFIRCPFRCSSGPCRRRMASLVEQYGANTGPVEPTSMGACQI